MPTCPEAERFSEAAFKLGRRPPINGKRVAKHDLLGALIWKHVGTSAARLDDLYGLVEEWHANRTVRLRDEP